MTKRSYDRAASRILAAVSFWLGVTAFGIGYGAFVEPAPGYEAAAPLVAAGVISVLGGGLGVIAFLIAEMILPRISGAHARRLYSFSALLGVIMPPLAGLILSEWADFRPDSWHFSRLALFGEGLVLSFASMFIG